VKKKFDIKYTDGVGEDMTYYLKQFKKEAMKKAEKIFGESESAIEDMLPNQNSEHFDMTDMYKTSKPKLGRKEDAVDNNLKVVLEQIKETSQRIASEIFKNE
jgi:hypothetical protein